MKMKDKTGNHTTNYIDTFIEVSEDTKAVSGVVPVSKAGKKTIAEMQYDLISGNPYKYTSDDVLFQVYADKNDLTKTEYKQAREVFFSKGQPCLRTSPLTKTYGFGIHSDSSGKIALYAMDTEKYEEFVADSNILKVKAMRSTRKQG